MNTLKLNVAQLSLEREGERRQVKGIAYGGGVLSYHGNHIVIDLASLQTKDAKIPLLHNHDGNRHVGFGKLSIVDNQLLIEGTLLSNTFAAEIIQAADEGFVWQMSVHVESGRVLNKGKGDVVNGHTLAVDEVLVFSDGVIREVSFTPIGVDASTSATVLSLCLEKGKTMNEEMKNKDEQIARLTAELSQKEQQLAELEVKMQSEKQAARLSQLEALGIKRERALTLSQASDDVYSAMTQQFALHTKQQAILSADYASSAVEDAPRNNPLLRD